MSHVTIIDFLNLELEKSVLSISIKFNYHSNSPLNWPINVCYRNLPTHILLKGPPLPL